MSVRPDLAALRQRLDRAPVTRFAPSPTGYLHLGHVVNAIYVWGVARALGGAVRLRIEDHDRIRSRPAYEASLLEDLDWLGFEADEGRHPPCRQSGRLPAYAQALQRLSEAAHVFACDCSRREIGGERYPGTCRTRGLADGPQRGLRVALDPGEEDFVDALLGPQRQSPAGDAGDLLLRDRDGHWTYQFAVTVDDARDGVNLVIRGLDLLSSTGRQLRLARMLDRADQPVFLHHPLLLDAGGHKLSKSSRHTGIRELRQGGATAQAVLGHAAAAAGLIGAPRPLPASAVPRLFE